MTLQPMASAACTQKLPERIFGIWFFILIECLIFSAYFIVYMLHRMRDPQGFAAAQAQLSPTFGIVNTLILLTSSWQVARSLHSERAGQHLIASRQAIITVGLGAAFTISKLTEWLHELRHGNTFESNELFAFYYFLTGIHIVHVLIGMVFMAVAIHDLRSAAPSREPIEVAATYWHMVDFLWVIIFALLYVVR